MVVVSHIIIIILWVYYWFEIPGLPKVYFLFPFQEIINYAPKQATLSLSSMGLFQCCVVGVH